MKKKILAILAGLLAFSILLTALPACNSDDGGGVFYCYEHKDLEGRWRRIVDNDTSSEIRFDGSGYIIWASPAFQYLVGKRAQVDCNGEIHGDVSGHFDSKDRIRLEGYDWDRI